MLTTATCVTKKRNDFVVGGECVSEHGKHLCESSGGTCVIERDGYYYMSALCVVIGAALLVGFVLPTVRRLQCELDAR